MSGTHWVVVSTFPPQLPSPSSSLDQHSARKPGPQTRSVSAMGPLIWQGPGGTGCNAKGTIKEGFPEEVSCSQELKAKKWSEGRVSCPCRRPSICKDLWKRTCWGRGYGADQPGQNPEQEKVCRAGSWQGEVWLPFLRVSRLSMPQSNPIPTLIISCGRQGQGSGKMHFVGPWLLSFS